MNTKTVLITGTSRGIGLATAKEFLKNAYEVIGTSTTGIDKLKSKGFSIMKLDLSSNISIEKFFKKLHGKKRPIEYVVSNREVVLDLLAYEMI